MSVLKKIIDYLIWTSISVLFAFIYMRIVLGPRPEPSTGFWKIFDFYDGIFLIVGGILGGIIALLYFILNLFYLKKKLAHNSKANIIRCFYILIIAIIVTSLHYICEIVINII